MHAHTRIIIYYSVLQVSRFSRGENNERRRRGRAENCLFRRRRREPIYTHTFTHIRTHTVEHTTNLSQN